VAEPETFEFTAAGGRFALGGLAAGTYEVFARAPGHALWRGGALELGPAGAPAQEVAVELAPGVRATGLVVDAATGLPIPDAVVVSETDAPLQILSLGAAEYLERPGLLPIARTGPDGGFALEDLGAGEHVLRASAPGHGAAWLGPRSPAEGPFDFALGQGGRIEGLVRDAAGVPVEGSALIVSLTDFGASHPLMSYVRALTDAGGRYVLEDLPAGYWPLLSFLGSDPEADPELVFVRVSAGAVTRRDFSAERAGVRLEGVLTRADGSPAAECTVWLTPVDSSGRDMATTSTDARGRFRFEGLAPRRYVIFDSRGAPPDMVVLGEVDLSSGADVLDHRLQLAGAQLSGRLVDGERDAPIEFAVVVLTRVDGLRPGFAGKTFSDSDGAFRFDQLEEGTYEVQALPTREALGPERVGQLVLREGAPLDLGALRLYPGGALELAVTGPDGRPAAGVAVLLRFEDGQAYDLVEDPHTDAEGRLTVPALKPGSWRVELGGGGFDPAVVGVEVVAGEPRRVSLELSRP